MKNKIPEWGPRHPNWKKTGDFPPVERNIKAIVLWYLLTPGAILLVILAVSWWLLKD
ncbi:MAG: hypothetical protein ACLP59_12060 [Bryobacteraceae bacterium]